MAHTDHPTLRRVLRREIAGTIGLLTDDHDFRAMRRYRSFAFDDHTTYLQQVEALLKSRAAQGSHTTLALFDPEDYAAFCADTGLDPEAPASRSRFTAHLAATGPTIPYDGRPLATLVPALVDEAVRQATWEYATALLSRLGPCATCGEDIGRAAFTRAADLLVRILDTAPPGDRHLVCSVSGPPDTLVSVLHADARTEGPPELDEAEALEFTSVLALGLATRGPGGLVMRISAPGTTDRVHGWRLRGGTLEPLTASEVFDAYCTDAETGEIIFPEPGVDYCSPPDLGTDLGEEDGNAAPGHHH
ncbi:hypothetical protein [Streptomyces collinus]|uniref:Uncharacterized protein n=1 Tax=Streptomyces collinus (strain DSM 40733 / Tue 365) TaxID=1214242 RepID=S5UMP3_STRC3|nr:hypothetical protein [Streptomyces collinus]AGS68258.1 hypothetical protein B446_07170 [Streptomyces collinus Tu 365]UJA06896.1 hypothetical protein HGI10_07820 [Streptomyces collinus]UJA18239.1 hypothetical protein HGI09_56290 [Streptomyces collinus]